MNIDAETRRAAAACESELPAEFGGDRLAFGFDGFVDTVRVLVDERRSADAYERLDSLEALGRHLLDSAERDSSATLEWLPAGTRTGGHAPHLGRTLGKLGYDVAMVGRFGRPPVEEFSREFTDHDLLSVGQPGYTDAVEFDDGKLLLTDLREVHRFDWETVRDRVALDALADRIDGAAILGVGYWVDTPRMATILDGLRTDLLPVLSDPPDRVLFDPGDVRQLSPSRLRDGTTAFARLDDEIPVTVSANRSETDALAEAVSEASPRDFEAAADAARTGLGVSQFVGHAPDTAVFAGPDTAVRIRNPRVAEPELTTSAGDHFNAGLVVGLVAGLSPGATLVVASSLANLFVRRGEAPSGSQLRAFATSYLDYFD